MKNEHKWKEGVNYFRIVEMTKSGTHLYSTSNFENINDEEKVSLSPNPTKDEVSLRFKGGLQSYTVNVYNKLGEHQERFDLEGCSILTFGSSYASGMYLVEVINEHNTQMFRFVKE